MVKKFKKTDIMVLRISHNGIKFSKPCSDCIKTLKKFNIRGIYYSLDNGELVYEKISNIENNHKSVMSRFLLNKKT